MAKQRDILLEKGERIIVYYKKEGFIIQQDKEGLGCLPFRLTNLKTEIKSNKQKIKKGKNNERTNN